MIPAPPPSDEETRLAALRQYQILDALPEAAFDDLTRMASLVCETPMCLISLVDKDRQWFLSKVGIKATETSRRVSFCAHAIHGEHLFVVEDALEDERFLDNPLVTGPPHIRFYAGVPLLDPEGNALGTLCVLDTRPRQLTLPQQEMLTLLGGKVVDRIVTRMRLEDLQASEAFRDAILKSSLDAIVIIDSEGRVVEFNSHAEKMFGYTRAEILGHPISNRIVPPQHRDAHNQGMKHYMATGEGPVLEQRIEITAMHKDGREFDVELAITPIRLSSSVFFSAYLRDISERKRVEAALAKARRQEQNIAARIQQTLLTGPNRLKGDGFEIAALSTPSRVVDGDFFDLYPLGPGWADIVIGDVMGKGVPAALLGAASKTAIQRSISRILLSGRIQQVPRPREIIASLHADVVPTLMDLESFITLCYARIEDEGRSLNMVSCGHPPLLLFHADGSWESLAGENMPLGFSQRQAYTEQRISLRDGDRLLFYSDGLTEARDLAGRFWEEQGLVDCVLPLVNRSPQEILEKVFEQVSRFSLSPKIADDLTLVVAALDHPGSRVESEEKRLSMRCDLDHLSNLREEVQTFFGNRAEVNERYLNELLLAVNEVFTNIYHHAYHQQPGHSLEIQMKVGEASGEVKLVHTGDAFAGRSAQHQNIDTTQDSGFGLFIMEQAVDRIEYQRLDEKRNAILLEKYYEKGESISQGESEK